MYTYTNILLHNRKVRYFQNNPNFACTHAHTYTHTHTHAPTHTFSRLLTHTYTQLHTYTHENAHAHTTHRGMASLRLQKKSIRRWVKRRVLLWKSVMKKSCRSPSS